MSRVEPAPAHLQYRRIADDDGELVFEVIRERSDLRLEVSATRRLRLLARTEDTVAPKLDRIGGG